MNLDDFWTLLDKQCSAPVYRKYHDFMKRMHPFVSAFGSLWILPAQLVDAAREAYNALEEKYDKALAELEQARKEILALRQQLSQPAPMDARITAWEKVYDTLCANWWNKGRDRRGDRGMDRAVNAIVDMAAIANMPQVPVTYGVDFSGPNKEHTVITVRQGFKVLHTIDVAAERKKQDWSWFLQFPKLSNFADVEARWASTMFDGFKPQVNVAVVQPRQHGKSLLQWRMRRAAYDKAQDVRRRNGRIYNHNNRWSKGMDGVLVAQYRSGMTLYDIACAQGREWEAVLYRLAFLAEWPRHLRVGPAEEALLHRMWMHFFTVTGAPLPMREQRLAAMTTRPEG